jgi:hypothetical protein
MKRFYKIFIFIGLSAPFLVSAENDVSAVDPFKASLAYGAGIIIILFFAILSFWSSRRLKFFFDKYNLKNYERSRQSREPAWKSRLSDTLAVRGSERLESRSGGSQKKDPKA